MGAPHLVVPSLGILAGVPELHVSSGSAETQAATQAQEETEFIRLLRLEMCKEVMTTPSSIRKSPRSEVVSSWMRKVFLTLFIEVNPQLFPCKMERSDVEGLALREAIGRTRALLRWCHSEASVADALTKTDNRAHELLRKFLQSRVWRIVWDLDSQVPRNSNSRRKKNSQELRDGCMML